MDFKLLLMEQKDMQIFKRDIQEAFQKRFEEVYGETSEIILPEKDIDRSLNATGSIAYKGLGNLHTLFRKEKHSFYVNKCGFKIVKFYNEKNPEPNTPEDFVGDGGDGMFVFEKWMQREF